MAPHRINLFEHPLFNKHALELGLTVLGVILLLGGVGGTYYLLQSFSDRFYPGTTIDNLDVSGKTKTEVMSKLGQTPPPTDFMVTLTAEAASIASSSTELGLHREIQPAVNQAFVSDQSQSLAVKLGRILGLISRPQNVSSAWRYQESSVLEALEVLQTQIATSAVSPTAVLGTTGRVATLTVNPGKAGKSLDVEQALVMINSSVNPEQGLKTPQVYNLDGALDISDPSLDEEEVAAATVRAAKLVGKNLTLAGDDQSLSLNDQKLITLLAFPQGLNSSAMSKIIDGWQTQVSRPPQEPEFKYDPQTLVVSSFKKPQNGLHLDTAATQKALKDTIESMEADAAGQTAWTADLPLAITEPTQKLADTNDLGIAEVIGFGESDYDHSIPTRIHNVALTSTKITNHIIKPGEEFSFNKALGDVSAATGFKPAYVIKNGQTELGDGGGVCQVSTTLFRSVLDAGLEVTKRRPHSYRVTYYELNQKPGFDATVYTGDVDLRFINDTQHAILIHSEADSKTLHMEVTLYGTSDGRSTEIKDYTSWDARPAPEPVYTVDPTLPPGTVKQVDWAASGIRTKFTNVVKDKNGQVIREDVYSSNYVPWSAKFVTGPI